MKVVRIEVSEVVVPARPDSINSPEVDHALHKLPFGGQKGWTIQFDKIFKPILRLHTAGGIVSLPGVELDLDALQHYTVNRWECTP